MNKMSRKKITIISVLVILIAALIGGGLFTGNFFVEYALLRPKDGATQSSQDSRQPNYIPYGNEEENIKKEWEAYEEWAQNVTPQSVSIQSEDNLTLRGLQYNTNPESHKWAILVHGYTSSNQNMRREARRFSLQGYNVLTPNMRAHGDSDGEYIGMGWLDRKDMLLWIQSIIAQDKDAEIVLYGESMGGATVMMTSGEQLPSNVKAVVEDCGYTSVYEMFTAQLQYRFSLPEFPIMPLAQFMANIKANYDIKEASALEQIKKTTVPIMFIHGSNDNYVPTEMVYRLYEACPTEKDLLVIEGADHGASSDVDPDTYYTRVFSFLSKYVN